MSPETLKSAHRCGRHRVFLGPKLAILHHCSQGVEIPGLMIYYRFPKAHLDRHIGSPTSSECLVQSKQLASAIADRHTTARGDDTDERETSDSHRCSGNRFTRFRSRSVLVCRNACQLP
jgi:hypothetical protein